jgi:hypothetical protein
MPRHEAVSAGGDKLSKITNKPLCNILFGNNILPSQIEPIAKIILMKTNRGYIKLS